MTSRCALRILAVPLIAHLGTPLPAVGSGDSHSDSDSDVPLSQTILVDCSEGDSINEALKSPAGELTIEISGLCEEDVVIERPHATLRGSDPSTDGIQAVATLAGNPLGAAVLIRGTHSVRLESLQLTGGARSGLNVLGTGNDISMEGCSLHGNGRNAIELRRGFLEMTSTQISEDNDGINAFDDSTVRVIDSDVSAGNNVSIPGLGVAMRIQINSGLLLVRGSATGDRSLVLNEGSATVFFTDLNGTVLLGDGGNGFLVLLDLDGRFGVEGKSRLGLLGVTQTSTGTDNLVRQDSTLSLLAGAGPTTLVRDTAFTEFANGDLGAASTLPAITCDVSSNALCPAPTSVGASTCGFCP